MVLQKLDFWKKSSKKYQRLVTSPLLTFLRDIILIKNIIAVLHCLIEFECLFLKRLWKLNYNKIVVACAFFMVCMDDITIRLWFHKKYVLNSTQTFFKSKYAIMIDLQGKDENFFCIKKSYFSMIFTSLTMYFVQDLKGISSQKSRYP